MQVTLLGTGDTTGTPTPGCGCETCEAAEHRGVERTRFSVYVRNDETGDTLLIDASPDLRQQFLRERVSLPNAAVITHIHFDHLDGLGNMYRLVDELTVVAAEETDPVTGESVAETVGRKYDYLDQLTVEPRPALESFEIAGFECRLLPVDHPPLLCYGLTVTDGDATLALTGDTSFDVPPASRSALQDADLLLANAIAPASLCEHHPLGGKHHDSEGVARTFGTKHMTREGALDLAERLDPERTRLVHVSHFYPADEAFEDPLAIDGETFAL
jgi:phosphoribosyl 1,2-cyclic phosphate phosphodiesterase